MKTSAFILTLVVLLLSCPALGHYDSETECVTICEGSSKGAVCGSCCRTEFGYDIDNTCEPIWQECLRDCQAMLKPLDECADYCTDDESDFASCFSDAKERVKNLCY